MRRTLIPALLVAIAIAGCGSSSGSSHAQSAVTTELSYFPTSTPFVLTVATNPNAASVQSAQGLLGQFPEAALGIDALEGKLASIGLDYDSDIKPLFGNPIAVGAASASSLSTSTAQNDVLAVWVTKSASALTTLVSKLLHSAGATKRDGASLYSLGSVALAIDGPTAILGTTPSVTAALDRHAHGTGFTAAEYASETSGLPRGTLMEAFGNLTGVLSQPSATQARNVPWVAAIRSYGAAISVSSSGLSFQYRLDTTGGTLSSSQLPIAPGTSAPSLAGTMPIQVGIDNPAWIARFVLSAEQATKPASYAKLQTELAQAKAHGFDVSKLIGLLTGSLIVESDTHTTIGRATVSNPSEASHMLAALAQLPKGVLKNGRQLRPLSDGMYAIPQSGGGSLTVGVIGNQLVLGKATVAEERAFAAAPASSATFAHGSVAFRIGLVDLLHLALKSQPPAIIATLLNQLGDLTGWTAASPSALTGSATLAIK